MSNSDHQGPGKKFQEHHCENHNHSWVSDSSVCYFCKWDRDHQKAQKFADEPPPQITEVALPHPSTTQVGGDHYKDLAIQPYVYCELNKLSKLEGDAVAYITRWRKKGGVEDLRKAIHSLELLISLEPRQEVKA